MTDGTLHPEPGRFAVVDIGSNTAKLAVYECRDDGTVDAVFHDDDTVRIGWRVSSTGRIDQQRADRLVSTLNRWEERCRELGCKQFLAVATQAFRAASNGVDVAREIESGTSWTVEILTADQETTLTIEGARPWLLDGAWNVVADIGGTSTEVISVNPDGDIWKSGSLEIGSGRLFDEELGTSPPPAGATSRAQHVAHDVLSTSALLPASAFKLLLPGGNGYFLDRLSTSMTTGEPLGPSRLQDLRDWLEHKAGEVTANRIEMHVDRANVLPAGLAIVQALADLVQPQEIEAIPSGIADGTALRHCRNNSRDRDARASQ